MQRFSVVMIGPSDKNKKHFLELDNPNKYRIVSNFENIVTLQVGDDHTYKIMNARRTDYRSALKSADLIVYFFPSYKNSIRFNNLRDSMTPAIFYNQNSFNWGVDTCIENTNHLKEITMKENRNAKKIMPYFVFWALHDNGNILGLTPRCGKVHCKNKFAN